MIVLTFDKLHENSYLLAYGFIIDSKLYNQYHRTSNGEYCVLKNRSYTRYNGDYKVMVFANKFPLIFLDEGESFYPVFNHVIQDTKCISIYNDNLISHCYYKNKIKVFKKHTTKVLAYIGDRSVKHTRKLCS